MWLQVSNYLNKFFTIIPPEKFYQDKIIKVFQILFKTEIKPNDIDVKFGTVYLKKINQSLKNEIFINKEEIIGKINQEMKNNKITDIKF